MKNHTLSAFLFLVSFSLNAQMIVEDFTVTNVDCTHEKGSITINDVGGGLPPYTYLWSTGASTVSIEGLTSGFYTVTVTDSHTPKNIAEQVVQVLLDTIMPIADAGPDRMLSCMDTTAMLEGMAIPMCYLHWSTPNGYLRGGLGPYETAWAAGIYILEATRGSSGCVDYDTLIVTQSADMPIADAGAPDTLYCAHPIITLDGTGSSQGANFTYDWFDYPWHIVSGEHTLMPTVATSGKYVLRVTDQTTGCSAVSSVNVVEDVNNPIAFFTNDVQLNFTCAFDTLAWTVTVLPEDQPYSYHWEIWDNGPGHIIGGQDTNTILVDTIGLYVVTVTNTLNGCTDIYSDIPNKSFATPTANAGQDVYLGCDGSGTAHLKTTGSHPTDHTQYFWYEESGSWLNPYNEHQIVVSNGGRYILKAIDVYSGCFDLDTVFVFSKDFFAQVDHIFDTITCVRPQVALNGASSASGADYTHQWYTYDGHIATDPNKPVAWADSVGTYFLVVTNIAAGCADTAFMLLTANRTKPMAILPLQNILSCEPPNVDLAAIGSSTGSNFTYLWDSPNGHILAGASSLSISIDKIGIYTLIVTDNRNGCAEMAETELVKPPAYPIDATATDATCHGYSDGSISALSTPYILWSLEGSGYTDQAKFIDLPIGTYQLNAKDTFGCVQDTFLTVEEPAAIWVSLGEDLGIKAGKDTLLTITSNLPDSLVGSVHWFENGLSICEDCPETRILPTQEGIYAVILTDINGCAASDSMNIRLLDASIYVPNAFSPDGDGNNDVFVIFSGNSRDLIQIFEVFDRWGNLLFSRSNTFPNNESNGWDGTFRGKTMPNGVYLWHARILENGKKTKQLSGDILLNRNNH